MEIDQLNLREAMVFLIAAGVVVPLVRRLRIGAVPAFLLVGLVIGPYGLGRFAGELPWLGYVVITDLSGTRALAELGVVFLLFMIGLELSVERLWAMRRLVFGLGGAQVVVSGVAIALIALAFGNPVAAAMVLGAGFALSSTAVVMQLLTERQGLSTETGRACFSILLCQDMAVLPILFMVGTLAAQADGSAALAFLWAMGQALLAAAVILAVGRLVIRPLFRTVGAAASRDMFLALVLVVIVGTALLTHEAGLSMALGAFLAGLLLAETEYRHEVEVDIEPFKGLLLGLFFVWVGMGIDIAQVAARPLWLAAAVVGLFAVKGPIVYVLARLFGVPRPAAVESALLLGQGGEFAFLVFGMALSLGLLSGATAQFMLFVTGLTMLATPVVAHAAHRLRLFLEARESRNGELTAPAVGDLAGHFIVVGYGRVGRMLGSILEHQELPYVALDTDARLVARWQADGANVYFGDASRADMLRLVGADRAVGLVVTTNSPRAAEQVVSSARQRWPGLTIYARALDAEHARVLIECGARHSVPETLEASLQLGELVLRDAGLPDEAARQVIEDRREAEQAAEITGAR